MNDVCAIMAIAFLGMLTKLQKSLRVLI